MEEIQELKSYIMLLKNLGNISKEVELVLLRKLTNLEKQLRVGSVSPRIYLTFADYSCDGAYSTLEKANKRLEQIKAEYPDMEGVYVISRDVE